MASYTILSDTKTKQQIACKTQALNTIKIQQYNTTHTHPIISHKAENINTKGKNLTPAKLIIKYTHSRPNPAHNFGCEVVFDHVLIHLYHSDFLTETDITLLSDIHPLYRHLFKCICTSSTTNCTPLRIHDQTMLNKHQYSTIKFVSLSTFPSS